MSSTSRSAFCSRCGQFNPDSSYLCARCGKYLRGVKRSKDSAPRKAKRGSAKGYEVKAPLDLRVFGAFAFIGASLAGGIIFFLQDDEGLAEHRSRLVTRKEYKQILPGMAYEEAVEIIGEPGDVVSESMPSKSTTIANYRWKNPDGSLLSLVVQNKRVVSKFEQNLPSSEAGK